MITNKKILITGGAGFLGSHLTESLSSNNEIVVADNLCGTSIFTDFNNNVKFIKMDIRDFEFENIIKNGKFDYIIHLAANAYVWKSVCDPLFDFNMNIDSTFKLLEILRSVKNPPKLIFASSAAVYDSSDSSACCETDKLDAISPYAVSKLCGEKYASVYNAIYKLPILIIRFFPMYGPRHKKQLVYDIIKKVIEPTKEFEAFGDGKQVRDLIYIDDAVKGIEFFLEKSNFSGEIFNLCSGIGSTIDFIIKQILKSCNSNKELKYTGNARDGDADIFLGSTEKINLMGYKTATSLEVGIAKTVKWFKEERE